MKFENIPFDIRYKSYKIILSTYSESEEKYNTHDTYWVSAFLGSKF